MPLHDLTHHLKTYPRISPKKLKGEFSGKSVIITGGGYGIGPGIARSFAEAGAFEVVLVGRTETKLENTAKELALSFAGTQFTYRVADVSSDRDIKALFDSLTRSPDILINNAGFLPSPANFIDADLKDFWEGFTTNVFGTALVTQAYLRHRKAVSISPPAAVVVTLNTIGAYSVRVPNLSPYGASKAALARWSELVSVDVPETTARFISLHPGAVKTAMGAKSGLEGAFPETDLKLCSDFAVWISSEEAKFLAGRFAWVNWDVDELVAAKAKILAEDLFRTALS